jgi:glutamate dehydrogenase
MKAMAVQDLIGTEDERGGGRLIEQMITILTGLRDDVTAGFAACLFGRAPAEDLLGYEARELAALAEDAWALLSDRKPGAPKIRFDSRAGPMAAEHIKSVSILEIVNDDMPFLVDSVLGELNEQGIEVRFVVHPVFTLERDPSGLLLTFRGEGRAIGAGTRESFIQSIPSASRMRRGGRKSSRRWSTCSATCASASWTGNRCSHV